jgi:hypothetical protein
VAWFRYAISYRRNVIGTSAELVRYPQRQRRSVALGGIARAGDPWHGSLEKSSGSRRRQSPGHFVLSLYRRPIDHDRGRESQLKLIKIHDSLARVQHPISARPADAEALAVSVAPRPRLQVCHEGGFEPGLNSLHHRLHAHADNLAAIPISPLRLVQKLPGLLERTRPRRHPARLDVTTLTRRQDTSEAIRQPWPPQ